MKCYIAKFEVPDGFTPKMFLNAENVDGWFINDKGALVSIPSVLERQKEAEDEAEWEYLHTEEPEVFRCSKCGGFCAEELKNCLRCGAKMINGK